jgi:catechol 2,3-dioxygenase-like lactoylglutathione lyase family enzyme
MVSKKTVYVTSPLNQMELSYFAPIKSKVMSNLNYIFPFFIVENLQPSVAFYVDKLGFEVRHIGPADGPYWAIVGRDNISIMLKAITPEIIPVPNNTRHPWAPWDAFVSTADPDLLFEEYSSRGLAFRQPIMDNHDGLHGFELADADGYVLFFGRPITNPANNA